MVRFFRVVVRHKTKECEDQGMNWSPLLGFSSARKEDKTNRNGRVELWSNNGIKSTAHLGGFDVVLQVLREDNTHETINLHVEAGRLQTPDVASSCLVFERETAKE